MCGIAGSTLPGARAQTRAMVDALVHRGPDEGGEHVDPAGRIVLGARRLSVIDVAHGHQPVANEDGSVWAVHNGEIYNFRALRGLLEADGHRFASGCDSEVLVHLYERYGTGLVHALEGMYAFAIWDAARGRLLLGRDRSGEKPLFVQRIAGGVAFASELGALLAADIAPARLDHAAIDSFYVLGYLPPSRSVVEGIAQLAPGTLATWSAEEGWRDARYWQPPRAPEQPDARKHDELVAETDELLTRAVRSRLVSDVPLGLFLSGGLDSTLVAAITRELRDVCAYSVGYDVGDASETDAAASAARQLGIRHEELVLRAGDLEPLALQVLSEIDQPLADRALVAMHALCARARRDVTVIVGGEGADEYFAGYPRYAWLARAAALRARLPAAMPALAAASRAWPRPAQRDRLAVLASPASAAEQNLAWISEGRAALAPAVYGERLRATTRASGGEAPDAADQAIAFDRSVWLPGDVLVKADRAGMLNSLEVRTPFLERTLLEFASSLPFSVHRREGGKALLKGVHARRLPGRRPPAKRGFDTPVADWLRGPLAAYLDHCTGAGRVVSDGLFDQAALRGLVREHAGGRDRSKALWPVLALNAWLEGPHGARVS